MKLTRNDSSPPHTTHFPAHAIATGIFSLLVLLVCLLAAGCSQTTREQARDTLTQPFAPTNYYGVEALPNRVHRVVSLPLFYDAPEGDYLESLDATFRSEANKSLRFELVSLSRLEMDKLFGTRQLSSTDAMPQDLFSRLYKTVAADAVLFTDITHYRPYQPLQIGVRAKLVDMTTGTVLWSFDHVYDAADPGVSVAARNYQKHLSRQPYPLDSAGSVLQSPARFAKYAAWETFRTLPPR